MTRVLVMVSGPSEIWLLRTLLPPPMMMLPVYWVLTACAGGASGGGPASTAAKRVWKSGSAASASRIASCNPRTAEGSAGSALTPSRAARPSSEVPSRARTRSPTARPASLPTAVAAPVARPVSICTADNAMLPATSM